MLARDLQSIVIYDLEGKFSGVRQPGSKLLIDIDGSRIVIVVAIGSSGLGLDLKVMTQINRCTKKVTLKPPPLGRANGVVERTPYPHR